MSYLEPLRAQLHLIACQDSSQISQEVRQDFGRAYKRIQNYCPLYFQAILIDNLPNKIKAEKKILEVCIYLSPLMKQFRNNPDLPYLKALGEGFDQERMLDDFSDAKLVQKIKNIEKVTQAKIPFLLLAKLGKEEELKEEERDKVLEWLKAIEEAKFTLIPHLEGEKVPHQFCHVSYFHRFLSRLCKKFAWECATLEYALQELGCKIFDEPDPKCLARRKDFPGEILENSALDPKKRICFAIPEDPSSLIAVYPNEAAREIERYKEKRFQYCLEQPKEKRGDSNGAIFEMERMFEPLDKNKWTSTTDTLTAEDLEQIEPIVDLLKKIQSLTFTPTPLLPEHFAFTAEGEMRACTLIEKGKNISFESIESFAWKCSSQNPYVFTHLMKKGRLAKSLYAKAYQDLLIQAVENRPDTFDIQEIKDFRRKFYKEIQAVQKEILEDLSEDYYFPSQDALIVQLNQSMIEVHQNHCPGHLLLPNYSEQCKLHALLAFRPMLKTELLAPFLAKKVILPDPKKDETPYLSRGIYSADQQFEIYHLKLNQNIIK